METYIRHYAHLDISDLLDEQSATNYAGGAFADIYRAQLRMGPEMLGDNRNTKDRPSWGISPYRSVTVAVKRFRVYLAESDQLERVSRISHCFGCCIETIFRPWFGNFRLGPCCDTKMSFPFSATANSKTHLQLYLRGWKLGQFWTIGKGMKEYTRSWTL